MNFIKKTALTCFMAISLSISGTLAFAEEAVNSSAASINETISHIESAIAEVNKSDFAASNLHIKAARSSGEQITGNEAIVKQANAIVIQGQISSKKGDVKTASDLLTEALKLYKSL
jgi:pectin methylesterase-like acyl-CoA thioesterase